MPHAIPTGRLGAHASWLPERSLGAAPAEPAGELDRPEWLACMREMCGELWPAPAAVTVSASRQKGEGWPGGQAAGREFALVPGLHRPPLLVPAGRRDSAVAIRHHATSPRVATRRALMALSLALGSGLGGTALRGRVWIATPPGAETIETYLADALLADIRLSMCLGPPRANRKPVLQLLADGRLVGWAKIGVNPLTCRLVRDERDSLARLAKTGLTGITIPRVLHHGRWNGLEVLVLSALPAWLPRRPLRAARLASAMAEVARAGGVRDEPLSGSGYLTLLKARLGYADDGPERAMLRRVLATVTAEAGEQRLTFGAWHGDWTPWNMACTSRGLLVWDWERFSTGVPLGFDALHHALQADVAVRHHDPRKAAHRCLEHAPGLLGPFGVPAQQARLTALLYLADLAVRYLADRQAQAGARLGATGTWLIPAIIGAVARLYGGQDVPRPG